MKAEPTKTISEAGTEAAGNASAVPSAPARALAHRHFRELELKSSENSGKLWNQKHV